MDHISNIYILNVRKVFILHVCIRLMKINSRHVIVSYVNLYSY